MQVIFITTANYVDPVPPALRNRMETIEIPGYTGREKLAIAKDYLVKRQLKENGLTVGQCKWSTAALTKVGEDYTEDGRQGQGIADPCLSRHAARVSRRLSPQLPQRCGRGWLETNAGLVCQEWGGLKFSV